MRVDPNQSRALLAQMQQSEQTLSTATSQLASSKRVVLPSDDPTAFGENVRSLAASAAVDRYTKNAETVVTQAQQADAALSSVVSPLTQAVSLGTEGANGTVSSSDRVALAAQVQGLLANVLTQANLRAGGQAIFGGTATATDAFTADPTATSGFAYNGNSGVNQASLGDGLQVSLNVPGDQIFLGAGGGVLGSLTQLVGALKSGTPGDISAATSAISAAVALVGQQRVVYANAVTGAQDQESYLSQETISLSAQQSSLTSIDLSTAATNLVQAQTAHSAILAVAAKVLPTSLLDYLK